VDGVPATFVVQFTWDPYANYGIGRYGRENRNSVSSAERHPAKQKSTRYTKNEATTAMARPISRARYTLEEDAEIRQLKEKGLSWAEIAKYFPGRTPRAIEVRYHTKLKTANTSRRRAQQPRDHSQMPLVVDDDAGEWGVEEICDARRSAVGGVELLVKWNGGEETWEPYENVAETEALDEYERLYGTVTVDAGDAAR
jgi:hypothetical protein